MKTDKPFIIMASLMRLEGATGVQTHMREFASYLAQQGVAHAVATPFQGPLLPLLYAFIALRRVLEYVWKPGAVWLYRNGHAFLLRQYLRQLMREHGRCVVYAQCPLSSSVALDCVTGPAQKVVQVIHFNGSQADEWIGKGMIARGGPIDQGIRKLESAVMSRVDGLVYVSLFMQDELRKTMPGLGKVRSAVIPNFVAPLGAEVMRPDLAGRDLVAIGTLEPRKNQSFLLKVLGEASRRGHKLTLTLVGDGPDRVALERLADEQGVRAQVNFEGFHPRGRLFIPGHKLCVHAAQMENLPLVLIEALSAGVPVVAARVGGIGEIFREGVEGRFWPLDDVGKACDVLLAVLCDRDALSRMSDAAATRFREHFESSTVASRLLQFLMAS
ncbi:MAG TPA: glycosyltransferase family 4 protein [Aquabacterium sp.]|uniref:glycosyltransferase family 4 protein n=1 Tax=Aquabacterium sp. TaxID=1872578 RepID=UPI002E32CE91|nr:glycosyltransferase family 4 protein [Aquabacterium sp.]HEX5355219.1 glycosyltransferase family 4 protein [Aquabacterium sp.]